MEESHLLKKQQMGHPWIPDRAQTEPGAEPIRN